MSAAPGTRAAGAGASGASDAAGAAARPTSATHAGHAGHAGRAGSALASRDLLSLRDLSAEAWAALLDAAERLSGPDGRRPLLAGRRAGALFFNPSLRTRTAFEAACHDLGAHPITLEAGRTVWQLEHRAGAVMDGEAAEHVTEAAGVLSRMVDVLGVRAFAGLKDAAEDAREELLGAFARAATVPLLNLESAADHPHQGLADALAVRRRVGRRARVVVRWAPHVRPLPLAVPHAALTAFAKEGHDVLLAHPEGYDLDEAVLSDARAAAQAAGGSVELTHDGQGALQGADVVYLKSWGARAHYGDAAAAATGFRTRRDWMLTAAALGGAWFMHCLPVRRNVVVEDAVLDGPRSLVLDQAAARVDVQKASLCRALEVTP